MPQPTESPEWATAGQNLAEVPSAYRASGWHPAEAPPAQWMNFWQRGIGRWILHLKERIDAIVIPDVANVARTNQTNNFSARQILSAEGGLWDEQLEMGNVRIYSSANPGGIQGGFGIAYNARFVTDHWERVGSGAAYWLSMNAGNVYLASVDQASWTSWPGWSEGAATALGDVFVRRNVRVGKNLTAETAVIGGVLEAASAHADSFLYKSSSPKMTALRIRTAIGPVRFDDEGRAYFNTDAPAAEIAKGIHWPIQPVGGGIGTIQVRFQSVAGADEFCVVRRSTGFSGAADEDVVAGTVKHAVAGAGVHSVDPILGFAIDEEYEYYLRWKLANPTDPVALGGNKVHGLRRAWSDLGPRNSG